MPCATRPNSTALSCVRGDRFVAGAVTVQITGTAAMGGGQDEGGLWVEAVGLAYRVFNVG